MNFQKTIWHDEREPYIDAGNLNRIENGIVESFENCDNKYNRFAQLQWKKNEKNSDVIEGKWLCNGFVNIGNYREVRIPDGISLVKITFSGEGKYVGQHDAYVTHNNERIVDIGWHAQSGTYPRSSSSCAIIEVNAGDKFYIGWDGEDTGNYGRLPERLTLLIEEIPLGNGILKKGYTENI